MEAGGRNYAPAKTTTDEWEAVMKAEITRRLKIFSHGTHA